jgi:hypothetical protein
MSTNLKLVAGLKSVSVGDSYLDVNFNYPIDSGEACHSLASHLAKYSCALRTLQTHGVGCSLVIPNKENRPLELRDCPVLGFAEGLAYRAEILGALTFDFLKDATIGLLFTSEGDEPNSSDIKEPKSSRHQFVLRAGKQSRLEEIGRCLAQIEYKIIRTS